MVVQSSFIAVGGRKLEVQRIDGAKAGAPTLLFLHEGLGSVAMWRDFPARVAGATGCPVVVTSRYGYGKSDVRRSPLAVRYMHDEGLESLPALLDALGIAEPVLFGHSDGASIAIIHAGAHDRVKALILEAPHVFVEDVSVRSIAAAKVAYETTDLAQKLARHHADADGTFRAWNDIWLHPDFRAWNIEEYLPRVACPALAIQGYDDEYGTMAQIDAIARQAAGPVELLKLERCGHSPHRDRPEAVLDAATRFISKLG